MFVRSWLRSPYPAPQTASASAPISASAKVCTIERSRSGLAWASCSSSQPETSILGPAAIAWLLLIEIFGRNSNANHAMAVSPHDATLNSGNIEHHISGRNLLPPGMR